MSIQQPNIIPVMYITAVQLINSDGDSSPDPGFRGIANIKSTSLKDLFQNKDVRDAFPERSVFLTVDPKNSKREYGRLENAHTFSHELGHVLFESGHTEIQGLMEDALGKKPGRYPRDWDITPDECEKARKFVSQLNHSQT